MNEACQIAREHANKCAERNKKNYDLKVRCTDLIPGSRVLVKNLTPRGGTGKLQNYWENEVHVVLHQVANDVPIYEVKPEQSKGRSRVLHHNLLLPCDYLPLDITPTPSTQSKQKHQQRNSRTQPAQRRECEAGYDNESEEDEYYFQVELFQTRPPESSDCLKNRNVLPQPSVTSEPRSVVKPRPQSHPAKSEIDLSESAPDIRIELENEPTVDLMQQDLPSTEAAGSPGPRDRTTEEENGYQFTRRNRRPPRKFTYDNLGSPSCYTMRIIGNNPYPHFASSGMTAVTPWSSTPLRYPQPTYVCY
ncbi:uncharacterized protein LOC132846309 isoform X2 [Tachysurus vachellii]|uniref:uncharacterized protein LOC132846309 isoform X2 n=1 Tax=Tachysurus vachellii TaxID=175792 RepID=UPI00296ADED8|nr:uncharacterized protein LOC132846309 isoform X2 [Tachysurus vachellii]